MELVGYVLSNLFVFAVLAVLAISSVRKSAQVVVAMRLYLMLILASMINMLLGTGVMIAQSTGNGTGTAYRLLVAVDVGLYPLFGMIWLLYADYQIHQKESKMLRMILPCAIPAFACFLASFWSLRSELFFRLSPNGEITYNWGIGLLIFICYGYFAISFLMLVLQRKNVDPRTRNVLILLPALMLIGDQLQYLFGKLPILWMSVSVMMTLLFFRMQNEQMYTDPLTGLFNRKELAVYLGDRIRSCSEKHPVSGIMIDLDNLKAVNDTFGHAEGDRAIISVASIIRSSIEKKDFAARFAGDEFVVVLRADKTRAEEVVASIRRNVSLFNEKKTLPYDISLSAGYEELCPQECFEASAFIAIIDAKMYHAKRHREC